MALSADNWWRKAGGALLILGISFSWGLPSPTMAAPSSVEVRNLGISRVGERTMVTVLLNQAANPRVTPYTGANRSQVLIEFPQAQAAKLPETLAGDEILVKSVKTEVSATGVKIIVAMFLDRPYRMSREILPLRSSARWIVRPAVRKAISRKRSVSVEKTPSLKRARPPP